MLRAASVGEHKGLYRGDAGQTVVRYLVPLERRFRRIGAPVVIDDGSSALAMHRHDPLIERRRKQR
jgi:hypothetical protein